MIFIIIDKIRNVIRWVRWLPILWFCPYVVEDRIRLCGINWYGTHRCDYDMCPMVRREP